MSQNQAVRTVVAAIEVLTALAMTSIAKATGAGVTLMDRQGWRLSTAATSQIVLDADDAQYRFSEGPCLTAWETRRPVRVQTMSTEPRWPEWVKTARELGLGSVLSAPLMADGRLLGAVKVYSTSAYAFDQQTVRVLDGVSETASPLLARVLPPPTEPGALAEFEAALRKSDPLQTAQNIIMERFRISAAAAIRMLATEAKLSGRPEREVAAAIIDAAPPR